MVYFNYKIKLNNDVRVMPNNVNLNFTQNFKFTLIGWHYPTKKNNRKKYGKHK